MRSVGPGPGFTAVSCPNGWTHSKCGCNGAGGDPIIARLWSLIPSGPPETPVYEISKSRLACHDTLQGSDRRRHDDKTICLQGG